MRLIDADALIMALPDTSADIFENCRNCKLLDKERITDIINNAPTIEAEPIRHGHWIPVNPDMYRAEYFECSVCGMYSRDGLFRKELGYEYCPNCGAKMEGIEE